MVSIVLVNYNGERFLRRCLGAIVKYTIVPYEVIFVDNASTDGSREIVRNEFPRVKLIESKENLGFSRGNNLGARNAVGRHFLFLNTDAFFVNDAVAGLSSFLNEHSNVGIVGPRLTFEDGSYQLSSGNLPSVAVEAADKARYYFDRKCHQISSSMNDRFFSRTRDVGWVTGACMLVRRDAFEKVGGFDEGMFMYFEDKDLCKRVRGAGWQVMYVPSVTAVHLLGGSSSGSQAATARFYRQSQLRYYEKHHPGLQHALVRMYLSLTGKQ